MCVALGDNVKVSVAILLAWIEQVVVGSGYQHVIVSHSNGIHVHCLFQDLLNQHFTKPLQIFMDKMSG